MDHLVQTIAETLSPYAEIRKTAEARLAELQKLSGYSLQVLQLLASPDVTDPAVRQAAAVNFKNVIKKGWDINREDGNDGLIITPNDRTTIKSHLVQLMCTVPPQIQSQLSESISLIANVDYPDNWQNLLPELVQQFQSSDPAVLIGVLTTANSIFKAFRYVQRNDELYAKIKFSLEIIQEPLLKLFIFIGQAVKGNANDPARLKPLFEALRLICRIVYSLNYQDLPEYFEDHIGEWMNEYAFYLEYNNPALVDDDEEMEPSVVDNVKVAVIANLSLYANKDEECLMEYLPKFTTMVWNLLMNVTSYPKHDMLATRSITFLSSLLMKEMHKPLFNNETTLREIVVKIVIPNLMFRTSDEERFEDDPKEYILTEIEGSDSESRRKCSQDLLKAMCRHFEVETTRICSEHVGSMLSEYSKNPNAGWVAKDAAIHLMMGIAIRRESSQGVSEINRAVNVMDFFQTQILPELQDGNHSVRPVLKAAAIKFVTVFRNQFEAQNLVVIMPMLIAHLSSPVVVVHTFAAYAIERILVTREDPNDNTSRHKFGSSELQQFLQPLFTGLFTIIDNETSSENEYVMKCVMRSLAVVREDILPVAQIVTTRLTDTLVRVAKNPKNPQFNHYLFESISVLVRSVCLKDASATSQFEPLLFVPFNAILQQDVAEFTPYVFQILAQLLELRAPGTGLGDAYTQLFPPLLTPSLWEKKGNVPALARLFQAYIDKAAVELAPKLNPILGVFQKLLASKATEISAFEILNSAVSHFPPAVMEPAIPTLFQLLLVRLQSSRTPRYTRLVTTFFALFVGKYGAQAYFDRMNATQANLGTILILQVWAPRLINEPPVLKTEAKIQVVGATKLLCDNPILLNDAAAWGQLFVGVVMLLTSSTFKSSVADNVEDVEIEIAYDAQFSRLVFATKTVEDPFSEFSDPSSLFVHAIHHLLTSNPAQLQPLIQSATADPKVAVQLEGLFKQAGLQI